MIDSRRLNNQTYEMGRFDIEFNRDQLGVDRNPELIFHINVYFQQGAVGSGVEDSDTSSSAGHPNRTYQADAWPDAAWIQFKNRIIAHSQSFWNGKFWLVPPATCFGMRASLPDFPTDNNIRASRQYPNQTPMVPGLPNSTRYMYAFNLYCRIMLREVATASAAHLTITAPHVSEADDGSFINSVGSGNGIFYNGIINYRRFGVRLGHTRSQRQYLHEIGHAFGQRHIGFYSDTSSCVEAPHAGHGATHGMCYIGDTSAEAGNVMGLGESLSAENAIPWKHFAAQFTGSNASDWQVSRRRVYPRILTLPGLHV